MKHTYYLPAYDATFSTYSEGVLAEGELLKRVWRAYGHANPAHFEGASIFEQDGRTIVRVVTRHPAMADAGIVVRDLTDDEASRFR